MLIGALQSDSSLQVLAQSRPFCFPAAHDSTLCETIQFISGLELAGHADLDLAIAYGINDCEAAVIKCPLAAVLQFVLG